jgi:hypothetical protein
VIQEQSTVPNVVDRGRNNMEAKKYAMRGWILPKSVKRERGQRARAEDQKIYIKNDKC